MASSILISVIMPIYNTGKYLEECIDSIVAQTFTKWELILIDDASDDINTIMILSRISSIDKRISLYKKKRKCGAALARNFGLEMARGRYVIILDSDDIFSPFFFESLYRDIDRNKADICLCCFEGFSDSTGDIIIEYKLEEVEGLTDRVFSVNDLPESGLLFWNSAPWNKIYRRKFLKNNNIRFQDLTSSNDVFFSVSCSVLARRICYSATKDALVYYRMNNRNQISANRNPSNLNAACIELLNYYSLKIASSTGRKIYAFWIRSAIAEIQNTIDRTVRENAYKEIVDNLKKNLYDGYFEDKKNALYLKCFLENNNSDWISLVGDYQKQLKQNSCVLLNDLGINQDPRPTILLWGYGKRGKAFESFWNRSIGKKLMITDKGSLNVGEISEFGNTFVGEEEALKKADIIIASNDTIYNELKNCNKDVIRLEKYCSL